MRVYLTVMLNVPIRNTFTYHHDIQEGMKAEVLLGARVCVPFGRSSKPRIAIVTHVHASNPNRVTRKTKAISKIMDFHVMDKATLELMEIAQAYYLSTPGDLFVSAMPKKLREGDNYDYPSTTMVKLIDEKLVSNRAKKQRQVIDALITEGRPIAHSTIRKEFGQPTVKKLVEVGAISLIEDPTPTFEKIHTPFVSANKPTLNEQQQAAYEAIRDSEGFHPFLLNGVTGSGKTEVYLRNIEECLEQGKQAIVLIPEISLSPQLLMRFEKRFPTVKIDVYHSRCNDTERYEVFNRFSRGVSGVLIGTRSSVFIPSYNLGILIIDEEHDQSNKAQDRRFAYNARDLAILKAKLYQVPCVMGSATPSLESLCNVSQHKYTELKLSNRATNQSLAKIDLIPIKDKRLISGLSQHAIQAIDQQIRDGKQVIVYLNRRAFSPLVQCEDCGHTSVCSSCDKPFHKHLSDGRLHCHVCGKTKAPYYTCPVCNGKMTNVGIGTERIEEALKELFPELAASSPHAIVRVDSDTTSKKGELERILGHINSKESKIIIGTQILSKGHDFSISLVLVVDVDGEIMSRGTDFRALEILTANMIQISGRSGRNGQGKVLIQTRDPQNEYFKLLKTQDYSLIANHLLHERKVNNYPPFTYMASLTATSFNKVSAERFLMATASQIRQAGQVNVSEPLPSPIKKRAGQYSESISVTASSRNELNKTLKGTISELESQAKKLSNMGLLIDIDPLNVRIK